MHKYGLILLAGMVAGCAPKSNPDESWKADCAKYYSHSGVDYMLCMKRKAEEEKKAADAAKAQQANQDSSGVRRSRVGHKGHYTDEYNTRRLDEAGAEKIL